VNNLTNKLKTFGALQRSAFGLAFQAGLRRNKVRTGTKSMFPKGWQHNYFFNDAKMLFGKGISLEQPVAVLELRDTPKKKFVMKKLNF
jgi:hypothetical protein